MITRYPYDQLQTIGQTCVHVCTQPPAHVREALRSYSKKHGAKYIVEAVERTEDGAYRYTLGREG